MAETRFEKSIKLPSAALLGTCYIKAIPFSRFRVPSHTPRLGLFCLVQKTRSHSPQIGQRKQRFRISHKATLTYLQMAELVLDYLKLLFNRFTDMELARSRSFNYRPSGATTSSIRRLPGHIATCYCALYPLLFQARSSRHIPNHQTRGLLRHAGVNLNGRYLRRWPRLLPTSAPARSWHRYLCMNLTLATLVKK